MIKRIRNLVFWWLDYVYVAWWQLIGFVTRYDATKLTSRANPALPPIILIPGVYEKWQFMKPIARLLSTHRYGVHVIEGLGYNVGTIEAMSDIVAKYIRTNDLHDCIIVAHSKGGLIGKYLMMNTANDFTIRQLIALNTPFSGSKYAFLLPLKTVRIFLPSSPVITMLAANQTLNSQITSIYSTFDPHIPEGSYLDGATNIQLDTAGHFRIMHSKKVHQTIIDALKK